MSKSVSVFAREAYPFVKEALRDAAKLSFSKHDRLSQLIAVGFRYVDEEPGMAFDSWMTYSSIRLFALSLRWCASQRGDLRRRMPLGIYRPQVDLPGTGRIRFLADAVYDLTGSSHSHHGPRGLSHNDNESATRLGILLHQAIEDADPDKVWAELPMPYFYYAFAPDAPPVFESTFTAEEWEANKVEIGGLVAWPAAMFARDPSRVYDVHPVDGSPRPEPSEAKGNWMIDGSGSVYPAAQAPLAVFCDCDHLTGRVVRNPSFAALKHCNLIDKDVTFAEFRHRHSRWDPAAGRAYKELSTDGYLGKTLSELTPEQRTTLVEALVGSSGVAGCPLSDEAAENAEQFLHKPAAPVLDAGASSLFVVRLAGPPSAENMRFTAPEQEVDLFDLGRYSERYQAASPVLLQARRFGNESGRWHQAPVRSRQSG